MAKNLPATQRTQETWVQSLGGEDPLEEDMASHSSVLAWRIPWTKVPGGLQSTGTQSHIRLKRLSTHTWTVARQAPLSMEFSRQVHWSG